MKNVIEAENICMSFGKNTILKHLSFHVPEGVIYAICGKNGIGKSVLFRILTGSILPDEGSVKIHGQQIGKEVEFPRSTGILIDRPGYVLENSGYGNLSLLGQISGLVDKNTIRASLELVGLNPDDKKPVRTYSVGMLQRLGLAQAIMENPQLILLDEPTSGLDYESQIEMHELFLKLRDQGKTIVFTSHSPWEVSQVSEKAFWLVDGKLQEEAPTHENEK